MTFICYHGSQNTILVDSICLIDDIASHVRKPIALDDHVFRVASGDAGHANIAMAVADRDIVLKERLGSRPNILQARPGNDCMIVEVLEQVQVAEGYRYLWVALDGRSLFAAGDGWVPFKQATRLLRNGIIDRDDFYDTFCTLWLTDARSGEQPGLTEIAYEDDGTVTAKALDIHRTREALLDLALNDLHTPTWVGNFHRRKDV